MKIIATIIFTALFLFGCKKTAEPTIDSQSNDLLIVKMESNILSALSDSIKVNANLIQNSKLNSFADYALDSYRRINENNQNQLLKSGNIFGRDLLTYLKNSPKPVCFEKPMTPFEKSMFLSVLNIISNKRYTEIMAALASSEDFMMENICEKEPQQRLLYLLASIKVGYLMRNGLLNYTEVVFNMKSGKIWNDIYSLSGANWENCLEKCMGDKYAGMNFIEWAEFAINPPAHVLWSIASCSWDCGWK